MRSVRVVAGLDPGQLEGEKGGELRNLGEWAGGGLGMAGAIDDANQKPGEPCLPHRLPASSPNEEPTACKRPTTGCIMLEDLHRLVCQHPEDLTLRLVCADWFEQHGEPRGEFIRLQLCLASPSLGALGDHREAALARQRLLFDRHHRYWNGDLHRRLIGTPLQHGVGRRQPIRAWRYARGFVEEVDLEVRTLLQQTNLIFSLGPLARLTVLCSDPLDVERVLKLPHVRQLKRLEFCRLLRTSAGWIRSYRSIIQERALSLILHDPLPETDRLTLAVPPSAGDWVDAGGRMP